MCYICDLHSTGRDRSSRQGPIQANRTMSLSISNTESQKVLVRGCHLPKAAEWWSNGCDHFCAFCDRSVVELSTQCVLYNELWLSFSVAEGFLTKSRSFVEVNDCDPLPLIFKHELNLVRYLHISRLGTPLFVKRGLIYIFKERMS
jgi:hypothetical protein